MFATASKEADRTRLTEPLRLFVFHFVLLVSALGGQWPMCGLLPRFDPWTPSGLSWPVCPQTPEPRLRDCRISNWVWYSASRFTPSGVSMSDKREPGLS